MKVATRGSLTLFAITRFRQTPKPLAERPDAGSFRSYSRVTPRGSHSIQSSRNRIARLLRFAYGIASRSLVRPAQTLSTVGSNPDFALSVTWLKP
jgi:hypothetical protein